MFVSQDGTVTGSVDQSRLSEVDPKTDEAKAQLDTLRREAELGQRQAEDDAARLAAAAAAQDPTADPVAATDAEIERLEARIQQLKERRTVQQQDDGGQASSEQQQRDADQRKAQQQAGDGDDAERADLEKRAGAAGVKVDKRWSTDTLRSEVDRAENQRQAEPGAPARPGPKG